jgi:hypothetical protein
LAIDWVETTRVSWHLFWFSLLFVLNCHGVCVFLEGLWLWPRTFIPMNPFQCSNGLWSKIYHIFWRDQRPCLSESDYDSLM